MLEVADVIEHLPPLHFLVVEYVGASHIAEPYAQLLPGSDGHYCEVVSENYVPAETWPIDRKWLAAAGWHAPEPGDDGGNWWQVVPGSRMAAVTLLSALHLGRQCPNPSDYVWYVGQSPPPPDGGEPVPVEGTAYLTAA